MKETTKIITTEDMLALNGFTLYPSDSYNDMFAVHNYILDNFTVTRWRSASGREFYACEGLGIEWKVDTN